MIEIERIVESNRGDDTLLLYCRYYEINFICFYDLKERKIVMPSTVRTPRHLFDTFLRAAQFAVRDFLDAEAKSQAVIKRLNDEN